MLWFRYVGSVTTNTKQRIIAETKQAVALLIFSAHFFLINILDWHMQLIVQINEYFYFYSVRCLEVLRQQDCYNVTESLQCIHDVKIMHDYGY